MKAAAWVALAALVSGGCRGRARATRRAADTAAAQQPWSCGGVHGEARLQRRLGHDGRVRLGAIADLHGDVAAATRAAAALAAQQVDAIVALGDLGDGEAEDAAVLAALATARRPILALAGDSEAEGPFHAAVKRAQAGGADVIDLVDTRIVDAGDVAIVSAPGYRYSLRGCHYEARDLEALRAHVGRPSQPIVLAAHAPPRDEGADGIDRGYGDANVGDPALRALAEALAPAAALCAHVDEAGGRTRGRWTNIGTHAAIVDVAGGRAETRVLP